MIQYCQLSIWIYDQSIMLLNIEKAQINYLQLCQYLDVDTNWNKKKNYQW